MKTLEGDKYPTQNLILLTVHHLAKETKILIQQKEDQAKYDVFYSVLLDFQRSINDIWDSLPQETLIAACLDPR
jgi:hypothetical protein